MRPVAPSKTVSPNTSTTLKTEFGFGFCVTGITRQYDLTVISGKTNFCRVRFSGTDTGTLTSYTPLAVEETRIRQNASELRLYLDVISDPSKVILFSVVLFRLCVSLTLLEHQGPDPPTGCIIIFLKYFDTANQWLLGSGKVYVPRSSEIGVLYPAINKYMHWAERTPLLLYEVLNSFCKCKSYRLTIHTVIDRKLNQA
jgi:hypothetical protein